MVHHKLMESKELAVLCSELADRKKGENILILDLRGLSYITDFFVIVSGNSEPHLRAIVDEIIDGVYDEFGILPETIDGTYQSNWVVIDYYDVVVHVMKPETRSYYALELLWGDAPTIPLNFMNKTCGSH